MKAAIISDIHSNLEALQAVIKDIKKRRIKKILCLGDLVGYGANPNECVKLCYDEADIIIAGNHDWAAIDKTDIRLFNPIAANAITWTKTQLTRANINKMQKAKLTARVEELLLVHASPKKPEQWHYLLSIEHFKKQFDFFEESICLIGHSHVPGVVFRDANGYIDNLHDNPFPIIENRKFIINVGSVGQPRDLDPRAAYAIYDGNNMVFEIIRLDYNIPLAQQKIYGTDLPDILGDRLLVGR